MEPRYEPSYRVDGEEKFLGYAGDIDVWTEVTISDGTRIIILVGPKERRVEGAESVHNFDVYPVERGMLSQKYLETDGKDIHVELSEMCQVYALCVEHGYITTE